MTKDLEEIEAREKEEEMPDEDYLLKYCEEESVLEENAEWRRKREERYEVLKREHLIKLRGEEEAAAILNLPNEEPEEEEDDVSLEDYSLGEAGDEGAGGVAVAPPPPSPPEKETTDLSEDLKFYLEIWEDCVTTTANWAGPAEYCLGQKFEEWQPA